MTKILPVAEPSVCEARLEFDVFLDDFRVAPATSGALQLVAVVADGTSTVSLANGAADSWWLHLEGGGSVATDIALSVAPSRLRWVHVAMDVVFATAPTGRIEVLIDGTSAARLNGITTLGEPLTALRVVPGLQLTRPPIPAASATYDNFCLTTSVPQ